MNIIIKFKDINTRKPIELDTKFEKLIDSCSIYKNIKLMDKIGVKV